MSGGGQMLSRVADHLYWLSRYLERAEHTARLLETSVTLAPGASAALMYATRQDEPTAGWVDVPGDVDTSDNGWYLDP